MRTGKYSFTIKALLRGIVKTGKNERWRKTKMGTRSLELNMNDRRWDVVVDLVHKMNSTQEDGNDMMQPDKYANEIIPCGSF